LLLTLLASWAFWMDCNLTIALLVPISSPMNQSHTATFVNELLSNDDDCKASTPDSSSIIDNSNIGSFACVSFRQRGGVVPEEGGQRHRCGSDFERRRMTPNESAVRRRRPKPMMLKGHTGVLTIQATRSPTPSAKESKPPRREHAVPRTD